jgi:hypothetical protein
VFEGKPDLDGVYRYPQPKLVDSELLGGYVDHDF